MMIRPAMMDVSRRLLVVAAVAAALVPAGFAAAEGTHVYAPGGVAIEGYDPVAYFTTGHAIAGTQDHMLKWRGAIWLFASAENLEAFEMNPASYAPQYGGFCAYGMGEGETATSDPQVFVVEDGRLYLYHNPATRAEMQSNFAAYVSRADQRWLDMARN